MQRIAILKPSALGDIVHAMPVLAALRTKYPQSHITWIVNRSFEPLLHGHIHLDATLSFDRGVYKKSITGAVQYSWQFAETLRQQRFDMVIDLQGLLRTGLMTAATGAAVKVGFANAREGARHFYTHAIDVPDADRIHAVDRYWRVMTALGCDHGPKQFHVPVQSQEQAAVQRELQMFPRPWIAVAVGARWVTKRWPPKHFGVLLKRFQNEFGGTCLFTGTADDTADTAVAATCLNGPFVDLCGKTTIPRLTALLASADGMVGNDTGPLHLAAALGTPCVAPYTCTKTTLHGPFGQTGGVETSVACGGSYLKQCPHQYTCFDELTPERLWPALHSAMAPRLRQSA